MKSLATIVLLLLTLGLFAQNNTPLKEIQVTGFINNGKVLLRWAPSNHISWQRNNNAGYTVYRKTVIRNGKVIDNPDSSTIGTFKPLELNKWEKYSDSSTFAIAAEAIYGKEFEVTTNTNGFIALANKSREQESRFSIGLLCADRSFTVACMMGLGFIDSTVKTNESYLYKVVSNYSDSTERNELGYALIDFNLGNILPRPFGLNYRVEKNIITVTLPYDPFKGFYNNFELDRSSDGINFSTISGTNYYTMSTSENEPNFFIFNDSLAYQVSSFYYRIRGKTPFDTFGPYSDTLEVKVMPSLEGTPWITDIKEIDDKISVSWNIPENNPNHLKGFMIYTSSNQSGPFTPATNENIDKNSRFTYLPKPNSYSYFRIAAVDNFDRKYFSTSRLFQVKDSIPPMPPVGLKGEFDSTGVVKLQWQYGKEPDLLGYQLLYSANPESEFTLMGKNFVFDSTYSANFPLNMLSSNLYFKAVAIDTRYNTSKASEQIVLVKPDTIPPSAPVIITSTDSTGAIRVNIAPSRSNDIAKHQLYFVSSNNKQVTNEIYSGIIKSDTSLIFSTLKTDGTLYCVAVDITGRKGISSKIPVYVTSKSNGNSFKVSTKNLIDAGALEISWDKTNMDGSIMIYRKTGDGSFSLIATVDANEGVFLDRHITFNSVYTYKLIYTPENGKTMSNIFVVTYK